MQRSTAALLTAVLSLIVAGFSFGVSLTTSDDGAGHQSKTIQFHVNEAKGDGAPTAAVSVPQPVAASASATFPDKQMKNETPPLAEQVAPGQLTAAQQAAAQIRAHQAPLPTAGASAGFKGCVTRFVQNQSSRNGVRPQLQVLHYTVSHNVPGWSDMLAILHLFDTSSAQASSNFIIDAEGHCYYIVPIEAKAWTQAAGNPFSVSYEVIDYGNESTYLPPAGYAKLRSVMQQVAKRTGIPLRRGAVSGCVPTRTGIVQHADFGLCGGGHHDINPFSTDAAVRIVSVSVKPVSALSRKRCVELNTIRRRTRSYHRRFGLPPVKRITEEMGRRADHLRERLRKWRIVCHVGPPGKPGSVARA